MIGIDLGRGQRRRHLVARPHRASRHATRKARAITLDGSRDIDVTLPDERGSEPMRVALDGKPFHQLEVTVLEGIGADAASVGFSEIEIPGVDVEEWTVLPSAVLGLLGANAASAPLAFTMSRERPIRRSRYGRSRSYDADG